MNTNARFNLFISIGKSMTKFAIFESDKIQNEMLIKISTNTLLVSKNFDKLVDKEISKMNLKKINKVFICSVCIDLNEKIKDYFESRGNEVIFLSNDNQFSLDLSNLYNPWELGADLIAQSIYVMHFFTEAIIVSFGTITVIYHVKNNIFSGCIFLPGITSSLDFFEKTLKNKVNDIELQEPKKIFGLNTHEAISIGLVNNVKKSVDDLATKLKSKCPIIFSGGNSSYFKKTTKWWYIENLDLLGLYIFSKKYKTRNKAK